MSFHRKLLKSKFTKNNITQTYYNYQNFKSQRTFKKAEDAEGGEEMSQTLINKLEMPIKKPGKDISSFLNATRKHYIIDILDTFDKENMEFGNNIGLDYHIKKYFTKHKNITLNDRDFVYDQVYFLMRNKLLLDVIASRKHKITWLNRFEAYYDKEFFLSQKENVNLPLNIRESFPIELHSLLSSNYKNQQLESILSILNERAPITLRANLYKCSREELLRLLEKEGFKVEPTKFSPYGVNFLSKPKMKFGDLDFFNKGYFEIQDEGSQLAAMRMKVKPGDIILDYCGGAAGKSLAFAPFTQNKGQIFIHDIRKNILLDAKKRLRRAGVQNFQISSDKNNLLSHLGGKCDWVLVDVPCSGTGTIRRNPEIKYNFSFEKFKEIRDIQQEILEEALLFVKPNKGKIVYTTCSILHEENLSQIVKFCGKHDWEIEDNNVFETLPQSRGMDGFFSTTLIKRGYKH